MVLSPCDDIGAVTETLRNKMGLDVKAFTSEILPEALRVTATQHKTDKQIGDITKATEKQLQDVVLAAKRSGHMLFAAGTPCQDNSNLRGSSKKGLRGPKSSLFYKCAQERKRLTKLAQKQDVSSRLTGKCSGHHGGGHSRHYKQHVHEQTNTPGPERGVLGPAKPPMVANMEGQTQAERTMGDGR